jgi:hypothetical protein
MDWLKKSFLLFLVTLLFISCVEKSPLPKLTTSSKIGIVDMEVVNFWNSGVSCWCTDSDELLVFAMLLIIIYVIPHWHIDKFRVAYWKRVHRPEISPLYDLNIENWWFE